MYVVNEEFASPLVTTLGGIVDKPERYADLAVNKGSLGDMIDRFLFVHGAYSTQNERDWGAQAPFDSPMYERYVVSKRKFRKLVRRGRKLLLTRGFRSTIAPGWAILAAARTWERQERGPCRGSSRGP